MQKNLRRDRVAAELSYRPDACALRAAHTRTYKHDLRHSAAQAGQVGKGPIYPQGRGDANTERTHGHRPCRTWTGTPPNASAECAGSTRAHPCLAGWTW